MEGTNNNLHHTRLVLKKRVLALVGLGTFAAAASLSVGALLAPAQAASDAPTADARVQIVHAAPFSNTLAGTSVSITVNSTAVLSNVTFGQSSSGYLTVTAGVPLTIEVFPAGSSSAAISAVVTLSPSVDYTVLAVGDGVKQPLELLPLIDDNTVTATAKVRVVHAAPLSNTITGTLVDIRTESGTLVAPNFPYKQDSGYLPLPPGPYDFKVTTPGGAVTAIDVPAFLAGSGDILTVIAVGDGMNQPLGLITLGDFDPLGSARVQVVHAAPFSNTLAGTAVNVSLSSALGSSTPFTNVVFGQSSAGYLTVTAGVPTVVSITPVGTVTPALTATLTLSDNFAYTVAAIGDGMNQPLELLALVDDTTPISTSAKIRIVHAAPISNTIAGTLVDVRTEANAPITTNFAYKANTSYLVLPPGLLDLKVTLPNTGPTAIDLPPVMPSGGDLATVFAIGDGVKQPLSYLVVGQLTPVPTANVWVVHAAPFSNTLAGTAVSVTVETELGSSTPLTNFVFGRSTGGYVKLFAGLPTTITVTPAGASAPAISQTLTLSPNVDYTVAAIGNGNQQPLELLALIDDNSTISTTARVRLVHAAPINSVLSATAVDIKLQSGALVTSGVQYKQNTGYLALTPGVIDINVVLAGTGVVVIDPMPTLFAGDSAQTIFVIGDGFALNQPIALLSQATKGGTRRTVLPLIFRSSNPAARQSRPR